MHKASPPTSADEIPAEAISEVMEHTVTMFLENTEGKDAFKFFNWRASLYNSSCMYRLSIIGGCVFAFWQRFINTTWQKDDWVLTFSLSMEKYKFKYEKQAEASTKVI